MKGSPHLHPDITSSTGYAWTLVAGLRSAALKYPHLHNGWLPDIRLLSTRIGTGNTVFSYGHPITGYSPHSFFRSTYVLHVPHISFLFVWSPINNWWNV